MSDLMDKIEQDFDGQPHEAQHEGQTSLDSKMDDNPTNYNMANGHPDTTFEENEEEYGNE